MKSNNYTGHLGLANARSSVRNNTKCIERSR